MSLNDWLSDWAFTPSDDLTQAQDTANIIADKVTLIAVERPGAGGAITLLDPQPVRLETGGSPTSVDGGLTVTGPQQITVLGFRGHPDYPNTNLRRGDQFYVAEFQERYTITAILVETRTSLQAIGEARAAQ
jgi:hypothetical protein